MATNTITPDEVRRMQLLVRELMTALDKAATAHRQFDNGNLYESEREEWLGLVKKAESLGFTKL
jgi:hypothetical protein